MAIDPISSITSSDVMLSPGFNTQAYVNTVVLNVYGKTLWAFFAPNLIISRLFLSNAFD